MLYDLKRRVELKRLTLMRQLAGALTAGWFATGAPALVWAAEASARRWWLPENVSTYGVEIDRGFYIILWITGIIFVAVEATLLIFLIRYRQRDGRRAHYTHGSDRLEIIWTVIPALILVWLAFFSQNLWAQIRGAVPEGAPEVEITAEQFAWNVRYPGDDRQFGTEDDIETLNQLHLPLLEPVVIHVKSKDVIHSFFLPDFRVKQDAVPGLTTKIWVKATKPGDYEIACAELCGLGHYRMKGFLTVEEPAAFAAWLVQAKSEM